MARKEQKQQPAEQNRQDGKTPYTGKSTDASKYPGLSFYYQYQKPQPTHAALNVQEHHRNDLKIKGSNSLRVDLISSNDFHTVNGISTVT